MKSNRWVRRLILFAVIPLLVPVIGYLTTWQVRRSLAAQTPGLSIKTLEFDGNTHRYAVVEPVGGFEGPRPLVVFLHSATECGTDGVLPAIKLPAAFLTHAREEAGAFILLPQFRRHDQGWNTGWHPLVLRQIEQTCAEYPVDPGRIYLVGMSMGGQGCWHLAADRPEAFAAVVPICGNGSPEALGSRLIETRIWAFHGADDRVIAAEGSRNLISAIKARGGQHTRYTEYPGVGHLCWDRALTDPELLAWMFTQVRNSK